MAKPTLAEPFHTLEGELLETFMAGHKSYRPDLSYPQSHSDVIAGIRAIMTMFEIKRSPLPVELKFKE